MNKKIFIRCDTGEGSNWSDIMEMLNRPFSNDTTSSGMTVDLATANLPVDNPVNYFIVSGGKQHLFQTSYVSTSTNSFLSIGQPAPSLSNQTLAITSVDPDKIFSVLDTKKYETIFFGYNVPLENPVSITSLEVISLGKYYGRNIQTGNFEDVDTGISIHDNTATTSKFYFWYSVQPINDSGLYYLALNPNTVITALSIDGTYNNVDFKLLNGHDKGLRRSPFLNSINGAVKIGENSLFATSSTLTINVFNSIYLTDDVPVKLLIDSSAPYTVNNNYITLDVSQPKNYYLKYKIITGTTIDYLSSGENCLIFEYVITK